jgi:hypothetical protein
MNRESVDFGSIEKINPLAARVTQDGPAIRILAFACGCGN